MDDKRTELAQQLITHLAQGRFTDAEQYFDTNLKSLLSAAQLHGVWQQLEGQLGAFQRQAGSRAAEVQGYQIIIVTCIFVNGSIECNIAFNDANEVWSFTINPLVATSLTANKELPSYIQPDMYHEVEVQVGQGEWSLPATLTIPVGEGPFPALVLVHGSGPNDRDETLGGNKPFRDLAWGLASQHIAVLRYDKRTLVHRAKLQNLTAFTVQEETIDDALAAVTLLRTITHIDAQHIFVLGHSLGGYLLPRIAIADTHVAGLIILAGSTRPFEDILIEQTTYILSLQDSITPEQQQYLDALKQQVARVKDATLALDTPTNELPFNVPASYWLDLRDYHPTEVAQQLTQPMLILQAESDYQVTMQDFQNWKDALASRQNVTLKSYPGLYHPFMHVPDGKMATPTTYAIAGHVEPVVVNDIAQWIYQINKM